MDGATRADFSGLARLSNAGGRLLLRRSMDTTQAAVP